MKTTQNANVAFPPSSHTWLITLSTQMDPLVEEQEMGVQLQSSLEDPLSNLLYSPSSAMDSTLTGTLTNANHYSLAVNFCTDSKSLCEALISSHPRTFSIHNSISSISSSIFMQGIPGHSSIPGNDLADKAAKEANILATDTTLPISLSSSIQVINETIRDAPPTHEQIAAIYKHRRVSQDVKQINNRKDDVLIARLRHPSLW